MESEMMIKRL